MTPNQLAIKDLIEAAYELVADARAEGDYKAVELLRIEIASLYADLEACSGYDPMENFGGTD